MAKSLRILITVFSVAAAIAAGWWIWNDYMYSPWTRDGRIRAEIITVAPDVSGWVTKLDIVNDQKVAKNQPLFSVDNKRYLAAVAQAKATLENKKYSWELAKHKYQRRKELTDKQAISEEDLETSRINTKVAKANFDLAKAELAVAQLNLNRTKVIAPEAGDIVNLSLNQGNYVSRGKAVLAIVKAHSFYVTGYFEETKIPLIHVGQQATITLMSGGKPFTGHVESIGRAISNSNTNGNQQLLPQINQTFNWVRLAQRIPVDIKLDPLPKDVHLSAGMTVSIQLKQK
ncbi:HlyD family secretion protein [Celerinatantimonas diazotrophica]|uniref:RND family efflux transporter MFP subunit n=1 Tax=Celerinatantimonas diazotrophica TaxID=412034 RepID=A0A4R1JAV8_9GAMM|nr:HlyD family secretion protein [Celerinatantimonas diazotrophica]TCK47690.1 RND family efflux transporter MFP subunit [Celerinatantimonas diazotrophica]CAG9296686.1 p-hydroxybenzoic acid efflux pump subunit AaeA [Celerinatantimonas diazotrophica]